MVCTLQPDALVRIVSGLVALLTPCYDRDSSTKSDVELGGEDQRHP